MQLQSHPKTPTINNQSFSEQTEQVGRVGRGEEGSRGNKGSVTHLKITWLMYSVTVIKSACVSLYVQPEYRWFCQACLWKDGHCSPLLQTGEVLMDTRWELQMKKAKDEGWGGGMREKDTIFPTQHCSVSLSSYDLTGMSRNTCWELAVSA